MMTRIKLADVKPVKCWGTCGTHLVPYATSRRELICDDPVRCVLLTAAAFAKMKRRIADLEETAEMYKVACRMLRAKG